MVVSSRTDGRYGKGSHTIGLEDAPELSIDAPRLAIMLNDAFNAPGYQPPLLPSTAIELMSLARGPDVTFPRVAALVQKEPLLATQVLRLAQSPVYRRSEPVRSLEQAASLLGLRALADLFLQASLTARVFRAPAYEGPMNELRDHSVATAVVARLVSRETSFSDEYAFLCGLLADVGIAASLIVLGEKFGGGHGKPPPIPVSIFWPVIRDAHEAVTDRLAQIWKLPADVRLIIAHHHSLKVGGIVHPMAAVVCVADSIATRLAGREQPPLEAGQVPVAMDALRLGEAQIAAISWDAERLLGSERLG